MSEKSIRVNCDNKIITFRKKDVEVLEYDSIDQITIYLKTRFYVLKKSSMEKFNELNDAIFELKEQTNGQR